MIVTVTPNASLDKTYLIEGFGLDRINRPSETWATSGGKGVNVARVLTELGRDALATGFMGGQTGETLFRGLDTEGIKHDFVRVQGESRLCIKIVDPKNRTQTEVNESGPDVTAAEVTALLAKLEALASGCEVMAFCGNCPPGVPAEFYYQAIRSATANGVKTVLDASGKDLLEGVKAAPYMVKPNVTELSQLAGVELCTLEEITRAAKSLKQYGVAITAVTMGRSGAIVTDGVQTWQATPPEIEFASAVGSGDSFLAAFLDVWLCTGSLPDALVVGTAAGAANAATYMVGFCTKESIMKLSSAVTLSKID